MRRKERLIMDKLELTLTTKFMRGLVAKFIKRAIYKKYGCKVDIQLNDLDINIKDGDATIQTNVEVKMNSDEFMQLMKKL